MKIIFNILIMTLLGVLPSSVFSQNNRLSIQTGLFHINFDKTPLINKSRTIKKFNWKVPNSYFGGFLNESLGFQYQRKIVTNNYINIEFMSHSCSYYLRGFTPKDIGPFIVAKLLKKINVSYMYKQDIMENWKVMFGGGIDYIWGYEFVYLFTPQIGSGWYEPQFTNIQRNDFGFNLRMGIEYSPINRLTLYSSFDFLGLLYLRKVNEKDTPYDLPATHEFFKENYNVNYLPSRWDLSWQFGIGYNFN